MSGDRRSATLPESSRDHDVRRVRVMVPHAKDCFLRDDDAPFVMYDGIEWSMNRNGTGRGGTSFYRFRCNDPKCPAIVLVNITKLSDWIGTGSW